LVEIDKGLGLTAQLTRGAGRDGGSHDQKHGMKKANIAAFTEVPRVAASRGSFSSLLGTDEAAAGKPGSGSSTAHSNSAASLGSV